MRLLFVSNLFPDAQEPSRGLENADILRALADRWEIRVLAVRPTLSPFRAVAAICAPLVSSGRDISSRCPGRPGGASLPATAPPAPLGGL